MTGRAIKYNALLILKSLLTFSRNLRVTETAWPAELMAF